MHDTLQTFQEYLASNELDAAFTLLQSNADSIDQEERHTLWVQLGAALNKAQKIDKAQQCFLSVLEQDAKHIAALLNMGQCCYVGNNFSQAVEFYTRAIALSPEDPSVRFNRGQVFLKLQELDKARVDFEQVLTHIEHHVPTLVALVGLAENEGDFSRAIRYQQTLVSCSQGEPAAKHRLALFKKIIGQAQQALILLDEINQQSPNFLSAWQLSSQIQMEAKEWGKAGDNVRRAMQIDPKNPLTHTLLGLLSLKQADIQKGWAHFQWGRLSRYLRPWVEDDSLKNLWQGGVLQGRRLLILSEYEKDVLFYIKYLPLFQAAQPEAQITLECSAFLKPVLQHSFPQLSVQTMAEITGSDPIVNYDQTLFIGDLTPVFFLQSERKQSPYLRPSIPISDRWRHSLNSLSGIKVGILPDESLRPDSLRALWERLFVFFEEAGQTVPITLIDCRRHSSSPPRKGVLPLRDWVVDPAGDVYAGLLSALDLVIGPACMETHLAAAMGVDTYFVLSQDAEWYWNACADAPWYGSSQQFQISFDQDEEALLTTLFRAIKEKQQEYECKRQVNKSVSQHRFEQARQQVLSFFSASKEPCRDAEIWMLKGMVEVKTEHSSAAEKSFRAAVRLQPFWPEALFNLGSYLKDHRKLYEASQWLQQALSLKPANHQMANTLANVFKDLGRLKDAIAIYTRIVEQSRQRGAHSNLLIALNYDPDTGGQRILEESIRWGKMHFKETPLQTLPVSASPLMAGGKDFKGKRLRIGYVSPDFRSHPVAFFIEPLLSQHDRKRFEIFAYANVHKPDSTTEKLKGYVDHWRDIAGLADEEAARTIHRDNLDVLIDLAGHTGGHRLGVFFYRPSPIQISYLGYPNTTGLPVVDYLITDSTIAPPEENGQHYTEKLLYLPRSFFCYQPPPLDIALRAAPCLENDFLTLGVFNNYLMKAHPMMLDLWADILQKIPNAILRVQSIPFAEAACREHFMQEFLRRGIAKSQLKLVSAGLFHDYLDAYNEVDMILDTYPWNGHTTTCHALWMGTPTLTLSGETHASRMGESMLKTLGMDEWVAYSTDEYIAKVQYWDAHKQRLIGIKTALRTDYLASPLCDKRLFVQAFEGVISDVCNQHSTASDEAQLNHD